MVKEPKWLRDIKRLLGVRPQFVFEGNIRDEVALPAPNGFELLSLKDGLRSQLQALGYPLVLVWNPITGIRVEPRNGQNISTAKEELKLGIDDSGQGATILSLKSIAELVSRISVRDAPPCALIIDYASRLTRVQSSLSEDERDFFRACEKAANDAQLQGNPPRFNPIIWLCNRAQDLPSWLILDNPRVHCITVAFPDLDTRQAVASKVVAGFYPRDLAERQGTAAATMAGLTEGMPLSALAQIAQLARDNSISIENIDDAVTSYQVGDLTQNSPWRSAGLIERIRKAEGSGLVESKVLGQTQAVMKVLDILKRSVYGLTGAQARSGMGRPKGILFFAGPTGVGKTEMAKTIAEMMFRDPRALLRFDMSEFSAQHSDARLIGAPPGYVGYEAGGELTNALRENPFRVILFDEIEKAHPRILDKFLQILEDGRLTDGRGDTVYFSETLIIFTSNLGIFIDGPGESPNAPRVRVQNVKPGDGYERVEREVRKAIANHFRFELNRPELLNRMGDNIVVFNFIEPDVAKKIFAGMLANVLRQLAEENVITVTIDETSRMEIERECTSELENGGRGIGARMETTLINPLARALFSADAQSGSKWRITSFSTKSPGIHELGLAPAN